MSTEELWENFLKSVKPIKLSSKKVTGQKKQIKLVNSEESSINFELPRYDERIHKNYQINQNIEYSNWSKKSYLTLDLHGCTKKTASEMLEKFIRRAIISRSFHVLVITGKGTVEKPSVLKEFLKLWIKQNPHLIISWRYAQPHKGGDGATLLVLRKKTFL